MKEILFNLVSNNSIAKDIYKMVLKGDTSGFTSPGQFVEISVPGMFLRRPISVCDIEDEYLTLIYKVVGGGTAKMAYMERGTELNLLTGLGHGFTVGEAEHPLLIGGGVGVPPLYLLARKWMEKGIVPHIVLGFNQADDIFLTDEFKSLGLKVTVATADGSHGVKGFVTDAIKSLNEDFDFFQSCGPLPMLKALGSQLEIDGEFSLEERMGCGFGACMGCSIHTTDGPARVCTEGPVFNRKKIDWNIL
ncbi:MAG: dihydroorotate dehydrogenase electron transfer subunit [Bacteroides sp.]|nr:dihydroorotate dehydrogenase electron transfer subunit [Bacteroides sp.]